MSKTENEWDMKVIVGKEKEGAALHHLDVGRVSSEGEADDG